MYAATVTVWLRAVLVRRALVSVLANRKAAMALAPDPKKNHLLAALPAAYLQRWLPQLASHSGRRCARIWELDPRDISNQQAFGRQHLATKRTLAR